MEMEDTLSGIETVVAQETPPAGGDPVFVGEAGGHLGKTTHDLSDLKGHVRQAFAMGLGDEQQVDRGLWKDVPEGEQAVIFVHQGGGDFLPRDLAE